MAGPGKGGCRSTNFVRGNRIGRHYAPSRREVGGRGAAFSKVTSIQGVNRAGKPVRIPYTANYYFFGAK